MWCAAARGRPAQCKRALINPTQSRCTHRQTDKGKRHCHQNSQPQLTGTLLRHVYIVESTHERGRERDTQGGEVKLGGKCIVCRPRRPHTKGDNCWVESQRTAAECAPAVDCRRASISHTQYYQHRLYVVDGYQGHIHNTCQSSPAHSTACSGSISSGCTPACTPTQHDTHNLHKCWVRLPASLVGVGAPLTPTFTYTHTCLSPHLFAHTHAHTHTHHSWQVNRDSSHPSTPTRPPPAAHINTWRPRATRIQHVPARACHSAGINKTTPSFPPYTSRQRLGSCRALVQHLPSPPCPSKKPPTVQQPD